MCLLLETIHLRFIHPKVTGSQGHRRVTVKQRERREVWWWCHWWSQQLRRGGEKEGLDGGRGWPLVVEREQTGSMLFTRRERMGRGNRDLEVAMGGFLHSSFCV